MKIIKGIFHWTMLAVVIFFAPFGAYHLRNCHHTPAMGEVFSSSKGCGCDYNPQPISIMAFQQFLADEGYYFGTVDGVLGPLTGRAWDNWYCDSCAIEFVRE